MSDKKFAFAVRAYVKQCGKEVAMVSKLFGWHNSHCSYMGKAVGGGKGVFVFEADCNMLELQHFQFMAMCEGPDISSGMNVLAYGLNIKDIHITTGRLNLLDLIESKPGVGSESFDSAQPELKLCLETSELPEALRCRYRPWNEETIAYIRNQLPNLKILDQDRVDRLNEMMVTIANDSSRMITSKGLEYDKEGVLSGNCLTIWNNTVDLNMAFLQVALDNKINNHVACPADSFGLTMSCLKLCGVGIDEKITPGIADSFVRTFPCYISTAITYASDLKKNPISNTYEMSEDISTPLSDNVYEDKAYSDAILRRIAISKGLKVDGSGFSGMKRSYHDSIFYDDCEGDASILKICFGMVQRFCGVASQVSKASDHEKLTKNIKSYSIMADWSAEEVQKGLVQCKQLHALIKDTSIQLLLMSAKAPNVQTSSMGEGGKQGELDYDICGHCAAMTKHNNNLYLAEMTAPVYILPITSSGDDGLNLENSKSMETIKKSYQNVVKMIDTMKHASASSSTATEVQGVPTKVTEELLYAQLCNDCAPDIQRSRAWLHMQDLDGVFWHIGGILGDNILLNDNMKTLGVPVSELVKPDKVKSLKAIRINQSKEEMEEFNFVSTYATPPILPYIKIFEKKVSPPLPRSVYSTSTPTIPLVYASHMPKEIGKISAWVKEDPETRYTCTIGNKVLGVQIMPRLDLGVIEKKAAIVSSKFCLK